MRTRHLQATKERGERWPMLTAYDQYTAAIFDEAGIPVLLVGDSAANNVFGYETTLPVTVDELLPLVRAVARAARRALVVADLPFGSLRGGPRAGAAHRVRFMKEGGAHAVKLEGGRRMAPPRSSRSSGAGIPVMAHIGFTPQSEHALGGYRVQGRGDAADQLLADARAVEEAGAFAVVLEMVPGEVAAQVTKELRDPHHRHRRRPGHRRPGAGLAGHGRACAPARRRASSSSTPTCAGTLPRRPGPSPRRSRAARSPPPSTPSSPDPGRGAAGDGHACVACSLSSPSVRPPLFSRGEPRHRAL